ncbi:MAG TPA: hypothetical protein VGL44_12110 [Gaiellales bacterium]
METLWTAAHPCITALSPGASSSLAGATTTRCERSYAASVAKTS